MIKTINVMERTLGGILTIAVTGFGTFLEVTLLENLNEVNQCELEGQSLCPSYTIPAIPPHVEAATSNSLATENTMFAPPYDPGPLTVNVASEYRPLSHQTSQKAYLVRTTRRM